MPVGATTGARGAVQQGCGRPCDHAFGGAPDSVHRRYGGHSSSQQRQVLGLAVMAAMKGSGRGFFGGIDAFFRAPPVVPELSASFLEPSMTKSSSLSNPPLHNLTVVTWTYTHS